MFDCAPSCAKFEIIWTMVGELMHGREVANKLIGVDVCTWSTHMVPQNFESGWYRNVVSSSLFFSWTIIDTDDAISEGFNRFWAILN